MSVLEDTVVMIQREAWQKQIEEYKKMTGQQEHHIILWTNDATKTTSYAEENGANFELGHCSR